MAIAPTAAPMMIARRLPFDGISRIHWATCGKLVEIARPIGARASRITIAEPSRSALSTLRARNARNAADATKNASSANIVALHGAKMWS